MKYTDELISRYPVLCPCKQEIENAINVIVKCYENGGKLLICGNGGSCADAEHITGELMKGFLKKRPLSQTEKQKIKNEFNLLSDEEISALQHGLPAIPLNGAPALNTAFANDCSPDMIFAQQVLGYGKSGDVFLGISTSGNAKNVCAAAAVAKSLGLTVIALTGRGGGNLAKISDIPIIANETETFKIQELHLPIYHAICADTENRFFEE